MGSRLHASRRSSAGWTGVRSFSPACRWTITSSSLRPALCRLLHEEPADRGVFHAAAARDRHPIAYAITRTPPRLQAVLIVLVILPVWTSFLDPHLCVDEHPAARRAAQSAVAGAAHRTRAAEWLSTIPRSISASSTSYLPFMVLPLYAALEKLDQSLLEAAADLGCPRSANVRPSPCHCRRRA